MVPEARLLIGSADYLTRCCEINEILISVSAFRDDKIHHNREKAIILPHFILHLLGAKKKC